MPPVEENESPSSPSLENSSSTSSNLHSQNCKPKSRWFFRSERDDEESQEEGESCNIAGNSPQNLDHGWKIPNFESLVDNFYGQDAEKQKKSKKKTSSCLICECSYEEATKNAKGCSDDCLNRVLYYECGPNCPTREFCTNKRFQNHQYSKVEPFDAGTKGTGLRALEFIKKGTFVMEYVGEVLSCDQFRRRSKLYAKDPKHQHHYFMALKTDQVIDATRKGNISRFINHSCEPNCETQKWTVGKNLRIGFFTTKDVKFMEELTFDYKFQRYGKQAQKCFCGAASCRGFIDGGGENSKILEREETKKEKNVFQDELFDREFDDILSLGSLKNRDQVVTFGRLMLRAEDYESRSSLLQLLMKSQVYILRLFVGLHGCTLLWSWTVDYSNHHHGHHENHRHFQSMLLDVLSILPIPHRDMLEDSKILNVVERWAKTKIDETNLSSDICDTKIVGDLLNDMLSTIDHFVVKSSNSEFDFDDMISHFDTNQHIKSKSADLLKKWSSLTYDFKIPKNMSKNNHDQQKSIKSPSSLSDQSPMMTSSMTTTTKKPQYPINRPPIGLKLAYQEEKLPQPRFYGKERFYSRSKEERRREFEARVAREEEERKIHEQLQLCADLEHNMAAASFGSTPDPRPLDWRVEETPPPTMVVMEQQPPNLESMQNNPLCMQAAIPAELVLDPSTSKYWWKDRATNIFVYAASEEQIQAYNNGDISKIPHFFNDPATGLIHEVEVHVQQTPTLPHPHPQIVPASAQPEQDQNCKPHGDAFFEQENDQQQSLHDKIVNLETEIVALENQLTQKKNELQWLKDQRDAANEAAAALIVPPPPTLPKNWRMARDTDGKPYYYHVRTKKTQWEFPIGQDTPPPSASLKDSSSEDSNDSQESDDDASDDDVIDRHKSVKRRKIGDDEEASLHHQHGKVQSWRREMLEKAKIGKLKRQEHQQKLNKALKTKCKPQKIAKKLRRTAVQDKEDGEWTPEDDDAMVIDDQPDDDEDEDAEVVEETGDFTPDGAQKMEACQNLADSTTNNENLRKNMAAGSIGCKETFKAEISDMVVKCLNPFRKSDCKRGRILNNDDFKHLARKLTHTIMEKESKHRKPGSVDEFKVTESILHKAKDYIKRYMHKLGPVYKRTTTGLEDF